MLTQSGTPECSHSTKSEPDQLQPPTRAKARIPILKNLSLRYRTTASNLLLASLPLFGPVAIIQLLVLVSMSTIYHVVGARCPKIKKHSGIKLRPINKAKEFYLPNDIILFTCESTETTQSIKCRDDGSWSEIPPCPDPVNFTCPDLEPIPHGTFITSNERPYKVGTTISFRCENELLPTLNASNGSTTAKMYDQQALTTATATTTISTELQNITTLISENDNITQQSPDNVVQTALRFNLSGHRTLKCLPSSKWNYPVPSCLPVHPEQQSNVNFVLASFALILIPILILAVLFHLFIRWRKRQQQQERWKQYFTDYKYRHSKTSITFPNRPNSQAMIPVTDL